MVFPFYFLQYVNPTWYFNLDTPKKNSYFIDYECLPKSLVELLELDYNYSSTEVLKLDAAYQAWNKGFIVDDYNYSLVTKNLSPSLKDNYRFVRKYFHPLWTIYIFILRLICLNNPIKEFFAFYSSFSVKRLDIYKNILNIREKIQLYEFKINTDTEKVAVIIPTLNRYTWLYDTLKDLEKQIYSNFEVIVVDQSDPFLPDFYKQFNLKIKLLRQSEKALWHARNQAIESTDAKYLLLFDDDSRVENNWILEHLLCLDFYKADISSGISISLIGSMVPKNYSFYRWSDQVDTGNVMVKRSVFIEIGLFDRQFEKQRHGDAEFGLRSYLNGFKNISNPYAQRLHLKVGEGGLREMGSWDGFRPKSWFSPRPIPSVLYLTRKYFGRCNSILMLLITIPLSLLPYRFKKNNFILLLGSILMIPLFPIIIRQIYISWRKSSKMLMDGALIKTLAS